MVPLDRRAYGDGSIGICYARTMTEKLEKVIERVRYWPKARQEDVVEILLEMERQDAHACRLTDDQAEEVSRIRYDLAEGRIGLATDEEMTALWKACGL